MRRLLVMAVLGLCLLYPAAAGAASPSVTTGSATSIRQHSAVLNATINPGGQRTVFYFQYGLTNGYGAQTATKLAGSGTTNVAVKTGISQLTSGTVYHYRVVASNPQGTTVGKDRTFKTTGQPPQPPGVLTGGAFDRTLTGATLTGIVVSTKSAVTYKFQFGLTPFYGFETVAATVPAQLAPRPVSYAVNGLAPHRIYHYRLVASNKDGITPGLDQIFITGRVSPRAVTRNTRKHHLRGRRWRLSTSGRLRIPRGFPVLQSCQGTVRVRYLRGHRILRTLRVPIGGDCRYAASTVLRAGRNGSRIHVTTLFRGNALLKPRSARGQFLHIG